MAKTKTRARRRAAPTPAKLSISWPVSAHDPIQAPPALIVGDTNRIGNSIAGAYYIYGAPFEIAVASVFLYK